MNTPDGPEKQEPEKIQGDKKLTNNSMQKNVQNAVEQAQKEVTRSRLPWYRVSRRIQILVVIYLVLFALFSVLAWFVHIHPVLPVDVAITQEFQENNAPWLNTFMVAVSYPGNNLFLSVGPIVLAALFFWLVRLRLEALFIIGLPAVSGLLNVLIKYIVSRPRPTAQLVDVLQRVSGQSFPSGHVMSYVAFWGLLFSFGLILFKRDHIWQYALLIIPVLFVLLVGPSRIYLGAHWASDVIGAYLIGGLLLGLTLRLYLELKRRNVLAPPDKQPGERLVEPPPLPAHSK